MPSKAMRSFINHCARYFCRRRGVEALSWDDLPAAMHEVMRESSRADRVAAIRMLRTLYGQALNQCYDHAVNGEFWLIGRLAPTLREIVDAGANQGEWSAEALRTCPAARIHAFEPVPDVFAALERRLGAIDRVRLNRAALSDRAGPVALHLTPGEPLLASVHRKASAGAAAIECVAMRGDDYVRDSAIDTIDLLKIDCEGSEPQVVRGFADCFESRRISVCQLEYGVENTFNRWLLGDMYQPRFRPHSWNSFSQVCSAASAL